MRGHAHENSFAQGRPARIEVRVNGAAVIATELERAGLFILEADLPEQDEYVVEVSASPEWQAPPDDRVFTVNLSMIRLVPRD